MPRTAANNMPANRKIRRVMPALYIGMENEEIAVTATTITRKGLTIPACTAASPRSDLRQFPLLDLWASADEFQLHVRFQ